MRAWPAVNFPPTVARIAPFAVFMGCIAIEELLSFLATRGVIPLSDVMRQWLYLPRIVLTTLVLLMAWPKYTEIRLRDFSNLAHTLTSFLTGILIFILWINMDWTFAFQSQPLGFNPTLFDDGIERWLMVVVRLVGAVLVVPVMEELFWRSWLARYLIQADFAAVAIGRFTVFSFLATSVLFGLEHHFLVAGLMAGVLFNTLAVFTKSLAQCILAHAVANLLLAMYVLATKAWLFW